MKGIIGIVLLCACASVLVAQESFRAGLTLGMNNAGAAISPLADGLRSETRQGIIAGAYLEFPVSPVLSIALQPGFAERGATLSYRDAPVETGLFNYLVLPIHVHANLRLQRIGLFAKVGFSAAYLLSARFRTEFQRGYAVEYVRDWMNVYDVTIDGGVGITLGISRDVTVLVDLTYVHGLVNAFRQATETHPATWHARNLAISCSAAWEFHPRKE